MRTLILLVCAAGGPVLAQGVSRADGVDRIKRSMREGMSTLRKVEQKLVASMSPASGVCSVRMPRAGVSAQVDLGMVVPFDPATVREQYSMPQAGVPAPECPAGQQAAQPTIVRPANPSLAPVAPRESPAPTRLNPFGELVTLPRP